MADKLLLALKQRGQPFELAVVGVSMNPILIAGDQIRIQPQEDYTVGDVLIFRYNDKELLVHRLLRKAGERFYCKGDNAFQLEDVTAEQIIGKVVAVNGQPLSPCPWLLVALSYAVNHQFETLIYEMPLVRATAVYKLYEQLYLDRDIAHYQPQDLKNLLIRITALYHSSTEDMQEDVANFLTRMIDAQIFGGG